MSEYGSRECRTLWLVRSLALICYSSRMANQTVEDFFKAEEAFSKEACEALGRPIQVGDHWETPRAAYLVTDEDVEINEMKVRITLK